MTPHADVVALVARGTQGSKACALYCDDLRYTNIMQDRDDSCKPAEKLAKDVNLSAFFGRDVSSVVLFGKVKSQCCPC